MSLSKRCAFIISRNGRIPNWRRWRTWREFWSGLDEDLPSFGRVDACLARVGMTLETLMEMGRQDSDLRALKAVA